jgi:phage-related minor tail protein
MTEENRKVQLEIGTVADTSGVQVLGDAIQNVAAVAQQAALQASAGLDKIGTAAKQAGQQAGVGLDKLGAAAEQVNRKFEASIKKAMELNQALAAGPRGSAGFIETRYAQMGADVEKQRALLDQLRASEEAIKRANVAFNGGAASLNNLGMSAKATTAALRQVPMQFTDIVTSLAAGQAPLQVLVQQGGQLKDVFGGIGPAAKALGGYVMGLVTPLSVAAVALGGIGIAALQGSKELREFQNATTLTGNAIGLSASRFSELRDSISEIAGTKGKAAEALTEIARAGLNAGSNVKGIAEAAILMEKATGQAIGKTVEQFKELQKAPADGAAKLNEQTNFLTASIYRQIKALEEQGKAVEAANLAEQTYADAMKTRAQSVVDNAGLMERAWRGVVGGAKAAWDAMLGVGRTVSNGEQISLLQRNLEDRQGRNRTLGIGDKNGDTAATADLKLQIDLLRENERMEKRLAESQAQRAQVTRTAVDWEKQGDQFLTKRQQQERELTKARIEGQQLVIAGIITEKELTERLTAIRQKYAETTGQSEVAGIVARTKEQQQYLQQLQQQLETGMFGDSAKLSDGEKQVIKLQEELKTGITGVARAEKERALAAAEALAAVDKQVAAQERQNKAVADALETQEKQATAAGSQADSIRKQAEQQEAANTVFGKGKTAIEAMTLAQYKLQLAEAEATDRFTPAYIAALRQKVQEQERFVAALNASDFKTLNQSADEYARTVAELSKVYADELQMAGLTAVERDKIVAIRKIELETAKRIAEVDRSNLDDTEKQALRDKINLAAAQEKSAAVSKVVVEDWNRAADQINQSLTDALMRGFESGKGFAKNLRDSVANMFRTMVLQPIVRAIVQPVGQAVSGFIGGGGSGAGSLLFGSGGSASSLSNLNNISNLNNFGLVGAGVQAITGASVGASGASLGIANTVGAFGGDALGTLIAANGSWAGVSAGTGAAVGAAGAAEAGAAAAGGAVAAEAGLAAVVPVVGWIVAAAAVLYAIFGKERGGQKQDGRFGQLGSSIAKFDNDLTPSNNEVARSVAMTVQQQFDALVPLLGGTKGDVNFGVGFSLDPKGTSPTFLDVTASKDGQAVFSDVNTNVGRSEEELRKAMESATSRALFAAIQASDLSEPFRVFFANVSVDATAEMRAATIKAAADVAAFTRQFDAIGGTFAKLGELSVQARADMVAAAGGIEALSAATASYYENFYSEEEKRLNLAKQISATLTAGGVNLNAQAVLATTRAEFRAIMEAAVNLGEAGIPMVNALLKVSGAFASITPEAEAAAGAITDYTGNLEEAGRVLGDALRSQISDLESAASRFRAFGTDLRTFRDSLLLGDLSPLTPEQKYSEAARQFNTTLTAAKGGDEGALSRLKDVSSTFLRTSQVYNASGGQYQSDFAAVQAALTISAAQADAMATGSEAQLAVAKSQLTSLEGIHQGVLTVAEAMQQMAEAVAAAINAGINPGANYVGALTAGVTSQQVATPLGDVYKSTAGAAVIGGVMYTPTGNAYTMQDTSTYLNQLIQAGDQQKAYDTIKGYGITLAEADQIIGAAPGTLEDWAQAMGLPVFHEGTNFTHRGFALLDEGEAVIPRRFNPAAGGSDSTAALLARIAASHEAALARIESLEKTLIAHGRTLAEATDAAAVKGAGLVVDGTTNAASRAGWNRDLKPALA